MIKKKILVLGDIHGRSVWKDIVAEEHADLTIFLGDYVSTHDDISEDEQLQNLDAILDYKERNMDTVVLLRGNHDTEAAGFRWAACYPSFESKERFPKERFERLSQWAFVSGRFLFSHAGVTNTFLRENNLTIGELVALTDLNEPRFRFTRDNSADYCGQSLCQPPTWIRPESLAQDMPDGYTQIVGHTKVDSVKPLDGTNGARIWLCDALEHRDYLCIVDDVCHRRTATKK